MFSLALLKDTLKIHPSKFGKDNFKQEDAKRILTEEINSKYANKIVENVGLIISVWDVLCVESPLIHQGDGHAFIKTEFRLITFRPFCGEVLVGRVKSGNESGVIVTMGFFDDIFIPAAYLQRGSYYNATEGVWIWKYSDQDLFMDRDEQIRFKVIGETFIQVPPLIGGKESLLQQGNSGAVSTDSRSPAYILTASIAEDGLGLLSWWEPEDEIELEE